jgi:ABC-type transport system involved in multi-copper enzyme maturation permease subunit
MRISVTGGNLRGFGHLKKSEDMNALVKKEIRLLLPSWLVVLSLGVLSPWFWKDSDATFAWMPLFIFFGMILLAVDCFGREFSLGTFQSLLSQPITRRQVWRIKITVLFFAAALILAAYLISSGLLFYQALRIPIWNVNPTILGNDFRNAAIGSGVVAMIALVGGLWTTLLLRQIAAAFWITFLAPAGLLMLIFLILPAKLANNENVFTPLLYIAGVIYIVAGFWFAHRLFHRSQDAAWTGGVIAFSKWRYFESGSKSTVSTRHRRPIGALAKKELQLQSISWFCATALLALHVTVIVMRKVHGSFERDSLAGQASEFFWMLWLIMPLIISGTVVAEERRLGVTEGQFCQPAPRWFQFALKFFPAIFIGILLGGCIPLLLEGFAAWIGAPNPDFNPLSQDHDIIPAIVFFLALALGLALAGFYASTLAKNFLQALGAAVVVIIGCVLFASFAGHFRSLLGIAWNPTLTICVSILAALTAVPWLAWRNFNYFQERGRVWRRNVSGLAAAILFIFISSAALYNRGWEVFEQAEPAHGPAKMSLGIPPVLSVNKAYSSLQVRLPDGRVWFDYLNYRYDDPEPNRINWLWRSLTDPLPKGAGAQRFVSGSDWRSASVQRIDLYLNYKDGRPEPNSHVVGYLDTAGIKTDGTLWVSDASYTGAWTGDKMNRFGDETNWQQLVRARLEVLLLKNDGTLWRWDSGTNRFDWNIWQTNWPSLGNYQPHQIGTDSDWKEIWCNVWNNLAQKADGSVWGLSFDGLNYKMGREKNLDGVSLRTLSQSGNGETAYVRPDGTLWMSWEYELNRTNMYSRFVQVGTETNWSAVALNWQRMIAIKSDGSLWQWHFSNPWDSNEGQLVMAAQKAAQTPPVRLGIHNDWVAIASTWQDVIALAADGSLWLWPNHIEYEQGTSLKLPKQPEFLGNVFSKFD